MVWLVSATLGSLSQGSPSQGSPPQGSPPQGSRLEIALSQGAVSHEDVGAPSPLGDARCASLVDDAATSAPLPTPLAWVETRDTDGAPAPSPESDDVHGKTEAFPAWGARSQAYALASERTALPILAQVRVAAQARAPPVRVVFS